MATVKKRIRKRAKIKGTWLRAARLQAGVTQAALATALRMNTNSVSNWERNDLDFFAWLGALSALGLHADWRPPVKSKKA